VAESTVLREHVISDVDLLGGEPPAVVVSVVVYPAHDRAVDDDDVLRSAGTSILGR
jgi:hypothetical protein